MSRSISVRTVSLATAACTAIALAGTALWSGGLTSAQAAHADPAGAPATNPAFARTIAGTWWVDAGNTDSFILNIHADGTLTWNSNWQFGWGTGERFDSAVYGVWTQTGPRQITTRELGFVFDGDGLHWYTGRVTVVYEFGSDFQTTAATYEEEVFWPDQNPIFDEPFFSWDGNLGTGYRLNPVN